MWYLAALGLLCALLGCNYSCSCASCHFHCYSHFGCLFPHQIRATTPALFLSSKQIQKTAWNFRTFPTQCVSHWLDFLSAFPSCCKSILFLESEPWGSIPMASFDFLSAWITVAGRDKAWAALAAIGHSAPAVLVPFLQWHIASDHLSALGMKGFYCTSL